MVLSNSKQLVANNVVGLQIKEEIRYHIWYTCCAEIIWRNYFGDLRVVQWYILGFFAAQTRLIMLAFLLA